MNIRSLKSLLLSRLPRNYSYLYVDLRSAQRNLRYWKKLRFVRAHEVNRFVFVIDPDIPHPGLADRLKAIIHSYAVAKYSGYDFRLIFHTPFAMEDYLLPNQVDWRYGWDQLDYSLLDTKFYNEVSWREDKRLVSRKQYHCYNYSGNLLPRTFDISGYEWKTLFDELFVPSDKLMKAINLTGLDQGSYISVHLRFVNALENFEDSFQNKQLPESEKRDLIIRCRKGLSQLVAEKQCPIVVFSDSKTFLWDIVDMPVVVLNTDNIGHSSHSKDQDFHLKTFLDLMMISRSKEVVSIVAPELYGHSCFAECGAVIGGIPYSKLPV